MRLPNARLDKVRYPLIHMIIVIAIGTVNCGVDDFVAIARFARKKRDSLA